MKFLDFFSGIGGFRLGFEQAGHECVGHIEIDKFANQCLVSGHVCRECQAAAKSAPRQDREKRRGRTMTERQEQRKQTLMRYTKAELAEKCVILEHNSRALKQRFDQQYINYRNLVAAAQKVADTYTGGKEEESK